LVILHPREGVCGGAKIFGSALLRSEHFFLFISESKSVLSVTVSAATFIAYHRAKLNYRGRILVTTGAIFSAIRDPVFFKLYNVLYVSKGIVQGFIRCLPL